MKIVLNNIYYQFDLSTLAVKEYFKLKGIEVYIYEIANDENGKAFLRKAEAGKDRISWCYCFSKDLGKQLYPQQISTEDWEKHFIDYLKIDRTDKDLISVVERLGKKAESRYKDNCLRIIEVPDSTDWYIDEMCGTECVKIGINNEFKTFY